MKIGGMEVSPELMEKAKACTSPEELRELAQEEGRELSDGELDAIAGGGLWDNYSSDCRSGDSRDDIDPAQAHADFVNGLVDGGELD